MIDTTGKCSACGQTVGIDTIHTCSPQVTAPTPERRVVEAVNETDAGNHDEPMTVKEAAEWAKNSRALRNFGDERAFQRCCQTIRVREEALARLTAEVERLNVEVDFYRALQRTDNSQVIAALTAEVKRLTEEKAEAVAIAGKAVENLSCGSMGHTAYDLHGLGEPCPPIERLAARLAALSLPTPAPEATE